MSEDQHPVALTETSRNLTQHRSRHHVASTPIPRTILIGVGVALLLTCVESALWIFSPFHVFGTGTLHTLSTLLSIPAHTPLLLLVPVLEATVACILVQTIDKPLAFLRYIREVQKAQEQYRKLYTSLPAWSAIYETMATYNQDSPDPSVPGLVRNISIRELAQDMGTAAASTPSHQLILGPPGAGKTTLLNVYQYNALQRRRPVVLGRAKIPIYIPLKNYSLYLKTHAAWNQQGAPLDAGAISPSLAESLSLLDFLYASDLVGMHHLKAFLQKMLEQGRILLLCDGLNEVDDTYQAPVTMELARLMSQNKNQLVLTCREVDYREQPQLAQAVDENLVARIYINPLEAKRVRSFAERFIEDQDAGNNWRYTAGQVMEVINQSRLCEHCANPLMFFTLMKVIEAMGIDRAKRNDTRGRLLRSIVNQLIQNEREQSRWSNQAPASEEVLLFLSQVACAARWSNDCIAIQLPVSARKTSFAELVDGLHTWLDQHPARTLAALQAVEVSAEPLHEPYSHQEIARLLQLAQNAALIELSPHGILSFRHELIAAYFVAEYFVALGTQSTAHTARDPVLPSPAQDTGNWDIAPRFIMPVAMWAGLLDNPVEFAGRFATLGLQNPAIALEALTLGLLCTGIAYVPPQARNSHQLELPPDLEKAAATTMQNAEDRIVLAHLFTSYAEEGAQEIYQSLFPLLMIARIDEFVTLLDTRVVPDFFFNQLCDVVDNASYETLVKRLVRVLGYLGAVVIPRADELSHPAPGRSDRLRSAAINILGGTGEQSAVEPLIDCLHDANQSIVGRASNALIRLGPQHTFSQLMQQLEDRSPSPTRQQIHWTILHILERFLDESNPVRQPTPSQQAHSVTILLHILTSNYAPENQKKAQEILVRLGRTAEVGATGEKALELLVHNLSATGEAVARSTVKTLKEIGPAATPYLLEQLKQQSPEMMRTRIIEVLEYIRDPHALPYLLRFLDDPAFVVQQRVAAALRAFTPESIPGLIDRVLYSDSELVAARAEQILGDIGEESVKLVIQALSPVVPGRTHLLVHELERVRNPQAIPALIALLENSQLEQTLQVAIVHALGQFPDERVVAPLLDMLASSNTLIYEGAVNALSYLEDVALEALIAALDVEPLEDTSGEEGKRLVEQQTLLTSRIKRALLGMLHFPGERLLDVLGRGSDTQVQHVIDVFLAKGAEAAQLLVGNLFHPDRRIQNYVRSIVREMSGQVIVPALLEVLNHPEPGKRAVITQFLLKHPREAIPPLVSLLDDAERSDAAEVILLGFGPEILPSLVPGLDALNNMAQERTKRIIVTLVQQTPALVYDVVQLFTLSPPPPQRAHQMLVNLLTNELVDLSVPALLQGLEDAHLVGDVAEVLVCLVNKDDARSEIVLNDLLSALRMEQRRHGAEITLVEIGTRAVPAVGSLITDQDAAVAQAAQNILCEMGTPAFSFIWAAHSDTSNRTRRDAARHIFRRMPTVVIKDELVQLLSSSEADDISMALALLVERINDEALQSNRDHEMIPALLEYAQTHTDGRVSFRIIALLLLLGGNSVIDHMIQVLYDFPNHQERLIYAFLFLGEEAGEALLDILHDPDAPLILRAEAASLLGIAAPDAHIRELARMPGEYGLWAGQSVGHSGVLHPDRLTISLRALGGLLAGGHWDISELQNLRLRSKQGSAERELYEILLGWRHNPYISILENDLQTEQEQHKKDMLKFTQEMLDRQMRIDDLEHQLEQLHQEHGSRVEELEQANEKTEELRHTLNRTLQEKQILHDNLQRASQERQALQSNLQQVLQEKGALQAQVDQWRQYAEQLEQE